MKEGTVHHPELFEAIVKGYNIDTSNFVINTAHNLRVREGDHNNWLEQSHKKELGLFCGFYFNSQQYPSYLHNNMYLHIIP